MAKQWRTAKSLETLRRQVDQLAPRRNKSKDGTIGDAAHAKRSSDHNPWVSDGTGIGVVTALDITHDPASGVDCSKIVGSLVRSRDRRIKYIIWNNQIISSQVQPWKWRKYMGSNPHTQHFHVSVLPAPHLYDLVSDWNITKEA